MRVTPSLRQEIERAFEVVPSRSTPEELCLVCAQPGCGDRSGNRSVNLRTGATFCFRCNVGGNIIAWARKIGIVLNSDPMEDGVLTDTRTLEYTTQGPRSVVPPVRPVKLPEGFTLLADAPDDVYTRLIGRMAARKNLTLDDFIEAGAGFTKKSALWEPFCIFPVVEYDTVVYYQGRTYTDVPGETTKKFPSRSELEHGAKNWVYGIDELRRPSARVAIVVESILNVLSLRWKLREFGLLDTIVPVAVFKHKVSDVQWIKLAGVKHVGEICLMFDRDARALSWADGFRFNGRQRLTIAEMPAGDGNKKLDPNDDVDLAMEVFVERTEFKDTTALYRHLTDDDGFDADKSGVRQMYARSNRTESPQAARRIPKSGSTRR